MNLFYEELPTYIIVGNEKINIVTDFREYIRFHDMIKSDELTSVEKLEYILEYFEKAPKNLPEAIKALGDFFALENIKSGCAKEKHSRQKQLYSFSKDFSFIYSAFKRDYNIDLIDIPYMHWWKFHMLFEGLAEDNEIKKRIMYRGIETGTIKDPDERKRILKIQSAIALEENQLTDYDIGDVFW